MKSLTCVLILLGLSGTLSLVINEEETRKNAEADPRLAMENEGLFEGDMMGIDTSDRNAITDKRKMWTGGKVYFQISAELESIRGLIYQAVNHYKTKTNGCVNWIESQGSGNYIEIIRHTGCYSYVGMVGKKQPLSLGYGCHYIGTVVHEMGHALGLHHEQNRSDRDKFLKINLGNVAENQRHNFKKLLPSQNFIMTPFDYASVMEYGHYAFSNNGRKTIESLNGQALQEPYDKAGLTDYDAFIINSLYSCPGYTRPPLPAIADVKYDFEDGKSPLSLESGSGQFGISQEGSNHYLVAGVTANTFVRIITPTLTSRGHTICIKFRYRTKGSLRTSTCRVTGLSLGQQGNIVQSSTWKNFQVQFKPSDYFRFYIEIRTSGTTGSSLNIDDYVLRYNAC